MAIPAIGVRSDLLSLGLDRSGALAVPQPGPDYDRPAWFDASPTPGQLGPAVIEGHVDSRRGGRSVFFSLGALRPGAVVEVTRADGIVAEFQVDGVRRHAKAAFPTAVVFGGTPAAALRLITCGGSFDRTAGHYRDNIVVFTHLVGSRASG